MPAVLLMRLTIFLRYSNQKICLMKLWLHQSTLSTYSQFMLLIYFGQDVLTGSNDSNKYSISEMGQPLRVYYASITRYYASITRYYVFYALLRLLRDYYTYITGQVTRILRECIPPRLELVAR